jgi:hypothetical protein
MELAAGRPSGTTDRQVERVVLAPNHRMTAMAVDTSRLTRKVSTGGRAVNPGWRGRGVRRVCPTGRDATRSPGAGPPPLSTFLARAKAGRSSSGGRGDAACSPPESTLLLAVTTDTNKTRRKRAWRNADRASRVPPMLDVTRHPRSLVRSARPPGRRSRRRARGPLA